MKLTLRKRRTAPSSWKLKAFNYNTAIIIMKRTGWKSDFSSEKSKTIRSEKRMKRENNEWKGISLKEHSQPEILKMLTMLMIGWFPWIFATIRAKTSPSTDEKQRYKCSFKCTEVTRAPLSENPRFFLSYKFTLKKTVSDRKHSALISSELLQVYVVTQCL